MEDKAKRHDGQQNVRKNVQFHAREYTLRMPESCLFCDNKSGSREHLWPKWIHERIDFGTLKMDRHGKDQVIIRNPEITVKSVCGICNNSWMSDLEAANIPVIGSLLNDIAITLDREQQTSVSQWVIKTAMMLDSTRPKSGGPRFYQKNQCIQMRENLKIPAKTRIWIGRIETKHLLGLGTDFRTLRPDTLEPHINSTIATLVAGHFVAQAITQRTYPKFANTEMPELQPKESDWDSFLIRIWPVGRDWIMWPPKTSFTNGGPSGIAYLLDRWRVGTEVDPATIASA
jgi:hypothetical protein